MKLYHGSHIEIGDIDLAKAKPYKDFGKGFYLTKYPAQAKCWADRLGKEHRTTGAVSEFEFDEYAYEDDSLKVLIFEKYDVQWLDFIVINRSSSKQIHDYDIIEGPVADDKVQTRINDYLNGEISKSDFIEELKWHEDTHQICFCTVASLVFLKSTLGRKQISKFSHIGAPVVEKLVTDFGFNEDIAADKFFSSKTFSALEMITTNELSEKKWTEIYKLLLEELNL